MYPVDTIKTRMQALSHPGQRVSIATRAFLQVLSCKTSLQMHAQQLQQLSCGPLICRGKHVDVRGVLEGGGWT
jgi:hypothetical protein